MKKILRGFATGVMISCLFLFYPLNTHAEGHVHTDECYNGTIHVHDGTELAGGACYSPVYVEAVCGHYTKAYSYKCDYCGAVSGRSGSHYTECGGRLSIVEYECGSCGATAGHGGICNEQVSGTVVCGGQYAATEYTCNECGSSGSGPGACTKKNTCGGTIAATKYVCNECGYTQNSAGSCGNENPVTCRQCGGSGGTYGCAICHTTVSYEEYTDGYAYCTICPGAQAYEYLGKSGEYECDSCYGNGKVLCTGQASALGYTCNKCGSSGSSAGTCSKRITCTGELHATGYTCTGCGATAGHGGTCSEEVSGMVTCGGSLSACTYECDDCGAESTSGGYCTEDIYCGDYEACRWQCTGCQTTGTAYNGVHTKQVLDGYVISCAKIEGHYYNGDDDVTDSVWCHKIITGVTARKKNQVLDDSSSLNTILTVSYLDGNTADIEAASDMALDRLYEADAVILSHTGQCNAAGDVRTFTDSVTVTTKYEVKVSFDANGGTADTSCKKVTSLEPYGTLLVPYKEGYSFGGWFTEASGGTGVTEQTINRNVKDHTLYAHWSINSYQVTITDSGSGATGEGSYPYRTTVAINAGSKPGYTFAGWESDSVTVADKNSAVTSFVLPASPVELTATWTINNYEVVLKETGDGAAGAGTYPYGTTVAINAGSIPGKRFEKWSVSGGSAALTDMTAAMTEFVLGAGDVEITAEWTGVTGIEAELNEAFHDAYTNDAYYDGTVYNVDRGITITDDMVTVTVYLDNGDSYVLSEGYTISGNGIVGLSGRNTVNISAVIYGKCFTSAVYVYGDSVRLSEVMTELGVSSYDELTDYLNDISQKYNELIAALKDVLADNGCDITGLDTAEKIIAALEELLSEKEQKLEELTAAIESKNREAETIRGELASVTAQKNALEAEAVRQALNEAKTDYNTLLLEKDTLLSETEEWYEEKLRQAETELKQMEAARRLLEQNAEELYSKIAELESDINELCGQKELLEEEISRLASENSELKKAYSDMENNYARLNSAYTEVAKEADELRNSAYFPEERTALAAATEALWQKEQEVIMLKETVIEYETKIVTLEQKKAGNAVIPIAAAIGLAGLTGIISWQVVRKKRIKEE